MQLVEIASGVTSASLSIERLITDLKAKGHRPEDVLPQEHQEAVRQALRPILESSVPPWGPRPYIVGGMPRNQHTGGTPETPA